MSSYEFSWDWECDLNLRVVYKGILYTGEMSGASCNLLADYSINCFIESKIRH